MLTHIEQLRSEGKRIGFTASTFDLLHPGHIAMLAETRSQCDFLIVGLLSDPTISRPTGKKKPIQTTFERFVQIQAVRYVDWLIPFDTEQELVEMLLMIMPTVRFVGEEYKGTSHTGHDIEGIEIVYNRRKHHFSSEEIRQRVRKYYNEND